MNRAARGAVGALLLLAAAAFPACAATAPAPTAADAPIAPAFDASIAASKTAMMADPAQALRIAAAAAASVNGVPADKRARAAATAGWLQGEALFRLNQPDKALQRLQSALATATGAAPNSKLEADLTLARGQTESAVGQVTGAFTDLQHAFLLYSRLGDTRGEAKALEEIGGLYSDAGDDARALRYYAEVPDIYRGDPSIDLAAHNNLGEVLKRLKRYPAAEAQYRIALEAARKLDSPLLQARILTNLASAQLLGHALNRAEASAQAALRMSSGGDAQEWRPFAWGVLAQVAAARGDLPEAKALLDRAFAGVDLATSPAPFRDFHATAVDVYERSGEPSLALQHLKAQKRLDDDAQRLVASGSAALASARFDFARQDLRIARLKADRVRQAAAFDVSRARLRATVLGVLLAAGGVIVVLLTGGFLSLRRSRNEVRAANTSLRAANSSLEGALKVKTEFLATTSHEIRTPLNGILGMTEVLLADRKLEPAVRERVEVVHGAGKTMCALIDDLLDVAKMESGRFELERGTVQLRGLLENAGRLWRDQAGAKGLRLDLALDACPLAILGDEARLRQIVFNLMSNAFKFTEAGGVTLSAAAEQAAGGEQLVIAVSDTGVGIPADKLELIFESFRQADGGVTRRFGGTGLGLTICRNLAEMMGGSVTVTSEAGAGSTFTLRLPLERAEATEPLDTPSRDGAPTLAGAKVVIVDPNQLSRRVLAKVMRGAAREVVEACDAAELGTLLEADGGIDLALVDATSFSGDALDWAGWRAGAKVAILLAADAPVPKGAEGCPVVRKPVGAPALLATLGGLWCEAAAEPAALSVA